MDNLFDVDYTVIRHSTTWYFLLEAMSRKIIRLSQIRGLPFDYLRYKMGRPNADFIDDAVKRIVGIERAVLEEAAEACFAFRLKPNIYSGAARLITQALEKGERVFFATSSFHMLIKPLERFFGITESVASSLEFENGKTTGRMAGKSFFGAKKKTAVEAWLAERSLRPENIRCYSDSYTDLPLLEYCGEAVAVNPDRFLKREAKKRGWQILAFRETLGR